MDTCRSDTDVRALEMTRVSLVIAVVAKTRGSARLVVNAVETFDNRLCSDLLLILQPVSEDGTNLCVKTRPTLWSTYLFPAASYLLDLYTAALHRVVSTAWAFVGTPLQNRVSSAYQVGMKMLRLESGVSKQAPATNVHVSSAILASSSQKLADMLLPRMAQAASRLPVAREGQRAPLRVTFRIPAAQLPATLAVLRYPYRPNSLVLEPHTDPLLVLNTALVAHTLGVTRLRDMCTAWLRQQPMTWPLAHTLLALQVRAKSAATHTAGRSMSTNGAESEPAGSRGGNGVHLRPAVEKSAHLLSGSAILRWVRGTTSNTTAKITVNDSAAGRGASPPESAASLGSVIEVATFLGLREDAHIQELVERAQDFALAGFQNLEQTWGQAQARAMLEDLPHEVLLCLITHDQLQVATENTVALAVMSWIHAGYQRMPPYSKTSALSKAAADEHEQHSLFLLSEVRFPYLTSSYLVHVMPVLTEGLGTPVRDALVKFSQEAFVFNSSTPEKQKALAADAPHNRFVPRPMYSQPPHDHMSVGLQLDLSSLSKTWLPAVSAVSPYLRSLVLSTPAFHTSSEDKYFNGFYWRLSVAADEFVGLSWSVLLRGHEVQLLQNTPEVMVHAGIRAVHGTSQTTDNGHHHSHHSHPHASRHSVPASSRPLLRHATVTDAASEAQTAPAGISDPATASNISPAGAEEDTVSTSKGSASRANGTENPPLTPSRSSEIAKSVPAVVSETVSAMQKKLLGRSSSGDAKSHTRGQVREFNGLLPPRSMGGFGSRSDAEVHSIDGSEIAGRSWIGLVSKLGHLLGMDIKAGEHSGANVTLSCTVYSCD